MEIRDEDARKSCRRSMKSGEGPSSSSSPPNVASPIITSSSSPPNVTASAVASSHSRGPSSQSPRRVPSSEVPPPSPSSQTRIRVPPPTSSKVLPSSLPYKVRLVAPSRVVPSPKSSLPLSEIASTSSASKVQFSLPRFSDSKFESGSSSSPSNVPSSSPSNVPSSSPSNVPSSSKPCKLSSPRILLSRSASKDRFSSRTPKPVKVPLRLPPNSELGTSPSPSRLRSSSSAFDVPSSSSPSQDPPSNSLAISNVPSPSTHSTSSAIPKVLSPSSPSTSSAIPKVASPSSRSTSSAISKVPSNALANSKVPSSLSASSSRAAAAHVQQNSHSGSVEFSRGVNGLDKVTLRGPDRSSAEVYLYGAQVMSWKNKSGEELLFVSSKATFTPPKPIRGGIPICFPQFLNVDSVERHGFVRTRFWRIDRNPPPLPKAAAVSSCIDLIIDAEDRWTWRQNYEFRQRIALGYEGELRLTARIRNIRSDGKPFTFTFAYHPYLAISDIGEVRVEGVEMSHYFDHLRDKERLCESGDCIAFYEGMDRAYLSTETTIAIIDHQRRKTVELRKDYGLVDAVLWNPWDKKAKAIPDLDNQEYKKFMCVGAAAIEYPIKLRPGQEWKGRMELNFVPTSYIPTDYTSRSIR